MVICGTKVIDQNDTETVTVKRTSNGYSLCIQHDQSGSAYGIELSESAYEQLQNHFLENLTKENN